jgi:hydroxyacyl-ACP dehydratase HTD2-like protein with hotdog domain
MMADPAVEMPTDGLLRRFTVTVEPRLVAMHDFGRDGNLHPIPEPGTPAPWSFFTFLRQQLACGKTVHELTNRDPERGLAGGVAYRGDQLAVGDVVEGSSRFASQRTVHRGAGALVVTEVETRWRAGGSELVETVTMLDQFGTTARAAKDRVAAGGEPLGAVSRVQIGWFTAATEDLQPLHHDPAFAAVRGFDDVLVPGTLLVAKVEKALRARGALTALTARFVAPVYPNVELELVVGVPDPDSWEMRAAGRTVARGAAR